MSFIADTSVTLPWCFADEATPWTEALLNRMAGGEQVVVPAHWSIEVTNGLLMAVRRGRVTLNKVHEFIDDLNDMPVQIEPASSPDTWPADCTRSPTSAHDLRCSVSRTRPTNGPAAGHVGPGSY